MGECNNAYVIRMQNILMKQVSITELNRREKLGCTIEQNKKGKWIQYIETSELDDQRKAGASAWKIDL